MEDHSDTTSYINIASINDLSHDDPDKETKEFQDSPQDNLKYEAVEERIENVTINNVSNFTNIPDYKLKTSSKMPILVKTPKLTYCIDGWNLIEEAKDKGEYSIKSHVFILRDYSNLELAIRKTALRIKPQGGFSLYAEKIRNTKYLYHELIESGQYQDYGHGGDRKSKDYTNREDDVRYILSQRLGKPKEDINKFLFYGKYLNDETFKILIEARATKDFFEKAGRIKTNLVNKLKEDELSGEEITEQTSEAILNWLEEFKSTGKIENYSRQDEDINEEEVPEYCSIIKSEKFKNPTINSEGTEEISEQEHKDKVINTLERLLSTFKDKEAQKNIIKEETNKLIPDLLKHINNFFSK